MKLQYKLKQIMMPYKKNYMKNILKSKKNI